MTYILGSILSTNSGADRDTKSRVLKPRVWQLESNLKIENVDPGQEIKGERKSLIEHRSSQFCGLWIRARIACVFYYTNQLK